jgi:diphthine synthase
MAFNFALHPDIKVKEQSEENMLRGRKIYEPPRYMTIAQCIEQILEVDEAKKRLRAFLCEILK